LRKIISALVFIAIITLSFASCGKESKELKYINEFQGMEGQACEAFANYLTLMINSDWKGAYLYESAYLWPSLDEDTYRMVRSRHPEFGTVLAKSTIKFTQSVQREWGVYGKTYDEAYLMAFEIQTPKPETPQEKKFVDLWNGKTIATAGINEEGQWKFMPSIGPESVDIDDAKKAYEKYIKSIEDRNFKDLWGLTPDRARKDTTIDDFTWSWEENLDKTSTDLIKQMNIQPISGLLEFWPRGDVAGYGEQWPWGVVLNLITDISGVAIDPNLKNADMLKLVQDDWLSGKNQDVLMIYEDEWKVVSENPLF